MGSPPTASGGPRSSPAAARLEVDARDHQELSALRGGGGSYAIVMELEVELHPVQSVYAGAPQPLARPPRSSALIHWLAQAPDELTSVGRLPRILPQRIPPPEPSGRVRRSSGAHGDGEPAAGCPRAARWAPRLTRPR
jgi:hypothetical protein